MVTRYVDDITVKTHTVNTTFVTKYIDIVKSRSPFYKEIDVEKMTVLFTFSIDRRKFFRK